VNLDNEKLDSLLLNIMNRSKHADIVMFGFFYTLYHTGLRFNDLYDITRFTSNGLTVNVQPSKKNNLRIIPTSDFHPQTLKFIENQNNFYFQYASYRAYTRFFNRLSADTQFYVKSKPASLHLFRHNYIRKLHFNQNKSLPEIQNIMGLKSLDIVSDYVFGVVKFY
jgi:integrase